MRRKLFVLILLKLIFFTQAYAQVKLQAIVVFDYSYGLSSGDLHSYISGRAFDGFHYQYRHLIKRDLSIGVRSGWNSFKKEMPRSVVETDRGTVSAVQTRFVYSMPFLATCHYYFRKNHYVMPYIGGGVGAYQVDYEKWFGAVQTKDKSFAFGFCPEVGLIFPFKNSGLGLMLNGRFNQVFYSHNELGSLRYFEASVGIYIGYPEFAKSY